MTRREKLMWLGVAIYVVGTCLGLVLAVDALGEALRGDALR